MSDRPLSFCMVTTFYPPHHFGGDAVYVHRLSNELAGRGHRVTVVYPPDAHAVLGGRPGPAPEEHANLQVAPLASHLGPVTPLVTYLTGRPGLRARELRRLFEQERFDVIHFHNVSLVGGPGILRYGDGVKLYTAHEHWLICPMHVLWKNNRKPCDRPTCLSCTLAFRRPPQLWRYGSVLDRMAGHVDLFLSPSRFTIRMHRERGFRHPMRHLPYFLPRRAAADGRSAPAGRPYFLVVARLEKLKGVQTLIETFRSYSAADLIVVGDGTFGGELRQQAKRLSHVRFLGSIPFDEIAGLYAGATALIVPSIGYETSGMVILEAFSQRTPAIVRNLGALPEAVEESGGGIVYNTEGELLEGMDRLLTDPALRCELGELGHRGYLERWSEEPHLRSYFEFIDELRRLRISGESHKRKRTALERGQR